jgi:hypothetical protein
MTYATYISKLRRQVGDTARRVHVDWTGDGTTTAFQMPTDTFPVLESSYLVKVKGSNQTENTHYTIDRQAGTIVFASAPTDTHPITFDGSAVYLTDADWLDVINDSIASLGDDFFKEFVDDSNLTTTQGMLSLDLSSDIPQCMAVYEFQHRRNTGEDWKPVEDFANWRYEPDNNLIYIGARDAFSATGELLRIRGLKRYILGDETTDDIDVQDKYITVVDYGCLARYWRYRYKNVIDLVSKMSTESTRTPLQELIMLSDRFDRLYELEKAKLKPQKPARQIPVRLEGAGRP